MSVSTTARILARRSLRKAKGQFAITGLLIAITAMMLHVAVILTGYRESISETTERLDTEDTSILLSSAEGAKRAAHVLDSDRRVADYEIVPLAAATASFRYAGADTQNPFTMLTSRESKPRIGRTGTVEELGTRLSDPIWLPYVMKTGGGYDLGDRFTVTIGGVAHSFHIQGFFESPMRDSLNVGAMEFQFTPASLKTLTASPGVRQAWHARVQQTAAARSDANSSVLTSRIRTATMGAGQPDPVAYSLSWTSYASAQTLTPNMFTALLGAFSLLIAAVVALIVRFAIRSTVVRDMPAFGTLEAAGMTAGQVMRAVMAPFAAVALCAGALGALASSLALPFLRRMIESQTGLVWDPGLSVPGSAAAVASMFAIVLLTAWLSSARVRKIPPVDALRGGEAAHSFCPTRLPLASTRGPAPVLIGLKAGLRARAQNVMVTVVFAIAVFAAVFALAIDSAILGNPRQFMDTLMGDRGNVSITAAPDQSVYALRADLGRTPGVGSSIVYDTTSAESDAGTITLIVSDDAPRASGKTVYEGRLPARAGEIAIGGPLASALGIGVGDDITISHTGNKATYLVTGLTQSTMSLGKSAVLTVDGVRQATPSYQPKTLAVYADGADAKTLFTRISSSFAGRYTSMVDMQAHVDSILNTYISMSQGLAVGILSLTGIVAILVVGLVVASLIARSRRDFGVLKALGFTNRQLSVQVIAAQLPSMCLGTAAGVALGWAFAMPALGQLLRSTGIMRLDAGLAAGPVVCLGAAFLALPVLLSLLLMRRARRITSRDLLAE